MILYVLYGESPLKENVLLKMITHHGRSINVSLKNIFTIELEALIHYSAFYPFIKLVNSFKVRSLILNVLFDPDKDAK
jgi:hypothetical protein